MADPQAVLHSIEELEDAYPDWRKIALNMYDQGASHYEVQRELCLSNATWELLTSSLDTDFRELIEFGELLRRAWWEAQARKNINNKSFQIPVWKFYMTNQFNWSEKTEQSITGIDYQELDNDKLHEEIKALQERLGSQ